MPSLVRAKTKEQEGSLMPPLRITDKLITLFSRALHYGVCKDCGETLDWEAEFDADGTNYFAYCCKQSYHMYPNTVSIEVEFEEEEE
jgi:hypothetical protein